MEWERRIQVKSRQETSQRGMLCHAMPGTILLCCRHFCISAVDISEKNKQLMLGQLFTCPRMMHVVHGLRNLHYKETTHRKPTWNNNVMWMIIMMDPFNTRRIFLVTDIMLVGSPSAFMVSLIPVLYKKVSNRS